MENSGTGAKVANRRCIKCLASLTEREGYRIYRHDCKTGRWVHVGDLCGRCARRVSDGVLVG
jgi:hypothetical protein